MKFYIPNRMLNKLEDGEFEWLTAAYFDVDRECILKDQYGEGWIIESDDGFNTFFTIKTGLQLPVITNQEYAQLNLDNIAFLGKERTYKLGLAWDAFERAWDLENFPNRRFW